MGALTYHPPRDSDAAEPTALDLHRLSQEAHRVLEGNAADVLPELLRAGGSPGGARPKVLIGIKQGSECIISGEGELPPGYEPWMVKFIAKGDSPDLGPVEFAYSLMARDAGIAMPSTQLLTTSEGDQLFAARRFDRHAGNRIHMHTFANLVHANFRSASCDYLELLKATQTLTRHADDLHEVFRRMVFNVVSHNRDDHMKNFAFLMDDRTGQWRLSPAYDLVYSSGPGGEHTLTVSGEGKRITRAHVLQLAERAGIQARKAEGIIAEVIASVNLWESFASDGGVSKDSIARIKSAIGQAVSAMK
jgi:serine/threonine-protein kinase HipA